MEMFEIFMLGRKMKLENLSLWFPITKTSFSPFQLWAFRHKNMELLDISNFNTILHLIPQLLSKTSNCNRNISILRFFQLHFPEIFKLTLQASPKVFFIISKSKVQIFFHSYGCSIVQFDWLIFDSSISDVL